MLSTGTERQPRNSKPFFADQAHPDAFAMRAQAFVLRQEDMADGIVTGRGQLDLQLFALGLQELVRDLHENAGAVAGKRVGADRAAMLEVFEDGERVRDDLVALAALEIGDEADAAGVMLFLRIEEAGFSRACQHRLCFFAAHGA